MQLAYWSTKAPTSVRDRVATELELIRNGTNRIFCGEYATQFRSGAQCLNFSDILPMKQLISGIQFSVNLTRAEVIEYVYVDWNDAAGIVFLVLVSIFIVAALFSYVDLFIFRNTIAYRASSPLFCALILFGIVLIYISLFFWVGEPTNATCMIRPWLAGIGFNLIFAFVIGHSSFLFR